MRATAYRSVACGALALVLFVGCGGGSGGTSLAFSGVAPSEGGVAGGTQVTLTGSGFDLGVDHVTFAWNRARDVEVVSDTVLTCVTPPGPHGVCDVAVVWVDDAIVLPECYAYLPPAPTLTGATPDEGGPNVDTRITLEGSGFLYEPLTVTLGGRACTSVTVADDAHLTCTVPTPGSDSGLAITVTTPGGTATLPNAYSYVLYTYSGDYYFVEFTGASTSSAPFHTGRARWGTLVTDGTGVHTGGEVWTNDAGTSSGPTAPPSTQYFVDDDRGFASGSLSNPTLVGRLSEDGSLGILGSVKVGVSATVRIVGRKEGDGYDDASLLGDYHYGFVYWAGTRCTRWGTCAFLGDQTATAGYTENVDGLVLTGPPAGLTYEVSSDGAVAFDWDGVDVRGQILDGGNLLIAAGGFETGMVPVMVVAVKASETARAGTFLGNYAFATMARGNPAWDAYTGDLDAGGDETGTVQYLLGHDGDGTWDDWPQSPYGFRYTTATDGTLEAYVDAGVTPGGHLDCMGAVTPDGTFAFLAGSRVDLEHPLLWLLLR